MTMSSTHYLRTLIQAVLQQHRHIADAINELAQTLDDELEARVQDRVAELLEQRDAS